MREAADALEFERAARLRDRLTAVRKAIEKQQMVTERAEDLDCFGLVEDELEAAVQVFYVRRGRVVGRKGFIVDKVEDLTRAQLVAQILEQHYAETHRSACRRWSWCPRCPTTLDAVEAWLGVQRAGIAADDDPATGARSRPGAVVDRRRRRVVGGQRRLPGRAQRQPRAPRRAHGSRSGCRSGATRRPCSRWSPATPARSSPATG